MQNMEDWAKREVIMTHKDELVEKLESFIKNEDESIALYSKYLDDNHFLASLPFSDEQRLREVLDLLQESV